MPCSPTYATVGRSTSLPMHSGSGYQRSSSNPDLTGHMHPMEMEAAPVAGKLRETPSVV